MSTDLNYHTLLGDGDERTSIIWLWATPASPVICHFQSTGYQTMINFINIVTRKAWFTKMKNVSDKSIYTLLMRDYGLHWSRIYINLGAFRGHGIMTKEAQSSCDNFQLKIQQIINILFTDLNLSVFWDCYCIKWGLLRQDICDLFAGLLTKKNSS